VFPEGTKGTGKTYGERYQLRRFGRGGFVQIAMRAGVPVIPIAVVGAEEAMPILWKSAGLAKLLRLPYVPITANMLAFGHARRRAHTPRQDEDPGAPARALRPWSPTNRGTRGSRIMDESEHIRQQIQEALYDMLRIRQSVWFG